MAPPATPAFQVSTATTSSSTRSASRYPPATQSRKQTNRQHGRFEPDIRHRTNDALVSLHLVSRGLAVMVIPQLSATEPQPGVAIRDIRGASLTRTIFAATRAADASRPSIRTALDAPDTATAAVAKHPGASGAPAAAMIAPATTP